MGVPTPSWEQGRGKRALVIAIWVCGCAAALAEHPAPGHANELWPPIGIGFLWLTLVWDGRRETASRMLPHLAALAGSFAALGLLLDWSARLSAQMAVLNVAASLAMALTYRAVRGPDEGWCPRQPRDLIGLAVAAGAGSVLCGSLGGFPTLAPLAVDTQLALWWTIRGTIFAFIAAVTFLVFLHGDLARWRGQARRAPMTLLLLPTVSVVTLLLAFDHERPLSWAMMLSAIWAGLVFTPIGGAVHATCVSLLAAAAAFAPQINRYQSTGGLLPDSYLMDIILTASVFATMLLALLRDERERASHDLAVARWRAESQAALLSQVFDSMSDGLVFVTRDGTTQHNPAARTLLGRRVPARSTGDWSDYFEPLEHEAPPVDGSPFLARSGGDRLLEVRTATLPGGVTLALFSDVTDHQRRIEELSGFAGVVAHDLRSPLTGLTGWLEMLEVAADLGDVGEIRGLLPRATAAAGRLAQVIEDWVSYSLQREGRLTSASFTVQTVAEEVIESWDGRAGAGRFVVDTPHPVLADEALVRQLLANLVGNAVKFARRGEPPHVTITSSHEVDEEEDWVRIEVADRGIGLPAGESERIFDEFHRVAQHSHVAGTGLGLALCRRVVHRHGGTIRADGNADGGATISFTLPLGTVGEASPRSTAGDGPEASLSAP